MEDGANASDGVAAAAMASPAVATDGYFMIFLFNSLGAQDLSLLLMRRYGRHSCKAKAMAMTKRYDYEGR